MKHYSKEQMWYEEQGDALVIGIAKAAVDELGEINFVELPEVGTRVEENGVLCVVESMKAAADLFSPVTGTIVEANAALAEQPSLMNDSPEDKGWIAIVKPDKK